MKKFIALLLCGILTATALTGCGNRYAQVLHCILLQCLLYMI